MNHATLIADWVRTLREIGRRAGRADVLAALDTEVAAFRRDAIHVVVAGGANSGKSTRVNALLGRNLLPVAPVRSTAGLSIRHGESDAVTAGGHDKPLSSLPSLLTANADVEVTVADEWLRGNGILLLERPPLDASDADVDAVIRSTLRGADVVVLIVDALMPVTRVDAALLAQCVRRELPLVVALSKCDHLSAEERAAVVTYVERHIASAGLELPLLVTDVTTGGGAFRAAIEAAIASADLERVRMYQAKAALRSLLSTLELAAHGGLEAQALTDAERDAEIRRRQEKVEAQSLVWMQVEQRLTVRRQKVDEQVRDYLATNRGSLFEILSFDLERTSDVNQWWTRDLPHRLHRELRSVSAQVSSSISRQVAGDIRWLHEELHRQFKFPLIAPLVEPSIEVEEVAVTPSTVPLANMQTFRVVSRVGAAATIVLAGIAMAHTGLAGATVAIGSIAGLAADQLAQRVAAKDRSAVRAELDRVLQRAWLDLAAQASAKLKSGYDDVVASLKKEQERWLESQLQALRTPAPAAASVDWRAVLEQAQALSTQMATEGDQP